MGGSSLAPEVIARAFGAADLHTFSTRRTQRRYGGSARRLDLERTLFVVSSKSGATLETRSHFDFFWEKAGKRGDRFVVITDPGIAARGTGKNARLPRVFAGEPTIGGRYSALSPFGLVPAALMQVDLDRLLDRAEATLNACRVADDNPGLALGLALGHAWEEGRDKVCRTGRRAASGSGSSSCSPSRPARTGRGSFPPPARAPTVPTGRLTTSCSATRTTWAREFFRWELATAVAGAILGINPFDQPNVQEAKDRTGQILAGRQDLANEPESSVEELLAQARPGRLRRDPGLRRPGRGGAPGVARHACP